MKKKLPRKVIGITVKQALFDKLEQLANEKEWTMSFTCSKLLEEYFENKEK